MKRGVEDAGPLSVTVSGPTEEVTCPRCGATLTGFTATVEPDVSDDQVRTPISRPDCETPLVVIAELALPDALGVDVWVEDRRDEGEQPE